MCQAFLLDISFYSIRTILSKVINLHIVLIFFHFGGEVTALANACWLKINIVIYYHPESKTILGLNDEKDNQWCWIRYSKGLRWQKIYFRRTRRPRRFWRDAVHNRRRQILYLHQRRRKVKVCQRRYSIHRTWKRKRLDNEPLILMLYLYKIFAFLF